MALSDSLFHHYKRSEKKDQILAFEKHIEFAIAERVPVIIHTRDADEDTISIIKKYLGKTNFLVHCFTGNLDFAKNLLELECLISFSGIITFKKSTDLRNVVKYVPYGPIKDVLPYLIRRAEENTSIAGQMGRELTNIIEEKKRRRHI